MTIGPTAGKVWATLEISMTRGATAGGMSKIYSRWMTRRCCSTGVPTTITNGRLFGVLGFGEIN